MALPPMKSPPSSADRVKATRIRAKLKAHGSVTPEEATWFADYERAKDSGKNERDAGASARRSHKVHYTEESEEAAAVGTGSAAEAAAMSAMVREEGRRLDSIIDRGLAMLSKACEYHERMAEALLNRAIEDGKTHRRLLDAVRVSSLARVDAEVALREAKEEDDDGGGLMKLARELAPFLGITLPDAEKKTSNGRAKVGG